LRIHPLKFPGSFLNSQLESGLRFAQCVFVGALFGHVARDFAEAAKLSVSLIDCGDDDVAPETCPVLSDSPALVFDAALLRSFFEFKTWFVEGNVFGWIKNGDVLANRLVSGIALKPLGTGVPGEDGPIDIQQENGVFLNFL